MSHVKRLNRRSYLSNSFTPNRKSLFQLTQHDVNKVNAHRREEPLHVPSWLAVTKNSSQQASSTVNTTKPRVRMSSALIPAREASRASNPPRRTAHHPPPVAMDIARPMPLTKTHIIDALRNFQTKNAHDGEGVRLPADRLLRQVNEQLQTAQRRLKGQLPIKKHGSNLSRIISPVAEALAVHARAKKRAKK